MDDEIIDLFFDRNETAISKTRTLYGTKLRKFAFNILRDNEDAEETENDTYLKAWNTIPLFLSDDLTLEAVRMRSRVAEDKGDISGERISVSVLFGETLIAINTKGVSSKAGYEMLMSLK